MVGSIPTDLVYDNPANVPALIPDRGSSPHHSPAAGGDCSVSTTHRAVHGGESAFRIELQHESAPTSDAKVGDLHI